MVPRVIFDTNVLFSAIGWRGTPHKCLLAVVDDRVESITCRQILDELIEKLQTKQHMPPDEALQAALGIEAVSEIVEVGTIPRVVPDDEDDDVVVECAKVGRATHIVSGDRHLLSLQHYAG